ncbi:thiamine pyrophosphate-binding protein [Pseudonocardia sp. C8]|uniref:thiamine pyrophosphate-binding protein n=1 Tax=Pseudonocardia sp. C8 TaxID=2762759 RepID=UPI0016433A64|nr:thiamine pyrophosphate-binding protein [Pseudonocardia sp. C8]
MSRTNATVAADILGVLHQSGATTVFGLPGVHNLPFFGPGPGSPVVVRHEQAATFAADGWARRSGRLGAAVVTTGPGATNALTGFGEAAAAGSPVVLVASEIPQRLRRDGRLRGVLHESRDQAAVFAPLAKAVFTPRTAAEAATAIREAVALATAPPRGPVYVDVPADVLGAPPSPPDPCGSGTTSGGRTRPDRTAAGDVRAVAPVVGGARTVVWAGPGCLDAPGPVAALARHLGAPLVTAFGARGLDGALAAPPHEPEVAELIGAADVLLAVGGGLDGMNTRNWTMPRPATLVTLDPVPPPDPPEWADAHALTGDVGELAGALRAATPARAPWWDTDLAVRVRDRLRADPATAEAFALVEAVESVTTAGAALVCDMAVAGYWTGGYARLAGPRGLAYPVGWGTLGFGLPAAIGVAATGTPTLAVVGDGGLAMAVGELATLVQERLPVTVLVVDDGGYGMLRYDQDRAGAPHAGVDLHTPDLVALAGAYGLDAVDTGIDGLGAALRDAAGSGRPRLVRVAAALLPPRTTSPRWHDT